MLMMHQLINPFLKSLALEFDKRTALESEALRWALEEIGNGEEGKNNKGPMVEKYQSVTGHGGAWCASYISWAYSIAAKQLEIEPVFKYSSSAKRLAKNVAKTGSTLKTPEPGAIICWHRGPTDKDWRGHVGIIKAVDGDSIITVEGNRGRYPAKVREFRYPNGLWRSRLYKIVTVRQPEPIDRE